MFPYLISELKRTWPDWFFILIGFIIIMGPLVLWLFTDVVFKFRKNPKTRVGIWLKEHHSDLEVYSVVWGAVCSFLAYVVISMDNPREAGSNILGLIVTTGGIAIVVAIFNAIFRRK